MSLVFTQLLSKVLDKKPIGFIDVGSRGGIHELVDKFAAHVDVLAFEADPEETQRLAAQHQSADKYASVHFEPTGLFNQNSTHDLHILTASTNSSLLPPNPIFTERYAMDKWQTVSKSMVETKTLDHVLNGKFADRTNLGEAIKLDTQGTEYEILEGAAETLRNRTQFLMIEVSFCELYAGQKLFSDIELYLRKFGFSFYGFDRLYNRSKKILNKSTHQSLERIIQADAYFFKDTRDSKIASKTSVRAELIQLCFAVAAGYFDYALEICNGLRIKERELFEEIIRDEAHINVDKINKELSLLFNDIEQNPKGVVLALGKFMDEKAFKNDFFDVQLDNN